MRRGELLGLHWADVNLDSGYAQVRYTLQHLKEGAYTFASPKTQRSRRKVSLTATAIAALRRRRQRQDVERAAAGLTWRDEDLVFTTATGGPLRANQILQRRFTPLLQQAGLPLIRFHDLRHTAATLMLLQDVHPKGVAEMLGHSTVSMTLDVYLHVIPDIQKGATAALDRLLRGGGDVRDDDGDGGDGGNGGNGGNGGHEREAGGQQR
jgi:integrase